MIYNIRFEASILLFRNLRITIARMDILTEQNLSSILIANIDLIYWSVRSSSGSRGDWLKGIDGGYLYFS